MKTKKQNKIIDLMLINSKSYKNHTQIKYNLKYIKPILKIIHKCHMNNKKILFVGMTKNNLNYNSQHIFINNKIWIKGILTNNKQILNSFQKNKNIKIKNLKLILNLKKKPDLIVIINENSESFIEGYLNRIPIITLNNQMLSAQDVKPTYNVFTNTESKKDFLISFIHSILKKFPKNKINFNKKLIYNKKKRLIFSKK